MTRSPRAGSARVVGKGHKLRTGPLNAAVREALGTVRFKAAPAGPIFRGKRGPYRPRGIRELPAVSGRRAAGAAGHRTPRRVVPDAVRVAVGVDLPTVAALLGHRRLDTARIYTQPGEDELQRAAARLEED